VRAGLFVEKSAKKSFGSRDVRPNVNRKPFPPGNFGSVPAEFAPFVPGDWFWRRVMF
jgi:hypothetical protein